MLQILTVISVVTPASWIVSGKKKQGCVNIFLNHRFNVKQSAKNSHNLIGGSRHVAHLLQPDVQRHVACPQGWALGDEFSSLFWEFGKEPQASDFFSFALVSHLEIRNLSLKPPQSSFSSSVMKDLARLMSGRPKLLKFKRIMYHSLRPIPRTLLRSPSTFPSDFPDRDLFDRVHVWSFSISQKQAYDMSVRFS